MEIKKSPKADLEGRKLLFRELGLIVALLVVLAAFEWSTAEKTVSTMEAETAVVAEEEIVPVFDATNPARLTFVIISKEDIEFVITPLFIPIKPATYEPETVLV